MGQAIRRLLPGGKMKSTICHHLLDSKLNRSHDAYKIKTNGQWVSYSWGEFYRKVEMFGCALHHYGVDKGDKVAILSNTRADWMIADLAILGLGAITVPIYQSNREDEVEYILNHSEVKFLICENIKQLKKFQKIQANCTTVKNIMILQGLRTANETENICSRESFYKTGEDFQHDHPSFFESKCQSRQLTDDATIIYTSGTTGRPKGVLLTHAQIMSEVSQTFGTFDIGPGDRTLSFLPYAHVMGRVELWGAIYSKYTICFAESIEKIPHNIQEVRPTLLVAVPRIFEKIYNGLQTKISQIPLFHQIFKWARLVGLEASEHMMKRQKLPLKLSLQYRLAKSLIYNKVKKAFGGKIRFVISGGAPLSQELGHFFNAAEILILEGYGLTETTAAITINRPDNYHFGTVGRPLDEVEIKMAEDGEILIKSGTMLKEYYKDPEATAQCLKNGYFHTGDIGEFTADGQLRITDRKKDLIKTSGGKYVAPQKIENRLKLNPYISQVLVHGDQKKFIVCLVTLNPEGVRKLAEEHRLPRYDVEYLSQNDIIYQEIMKGIKEVNRELASFETVKKFSILPKDFTIEDGELTPSLKVKRKVCDEKYRHIIDNLYGPDTSGFAI